MPPPALFIGAGATRCLPRKVDVCVSGVFELARKAAMRLRRRPARRTRVDEELAGPPVVEEEQYIPPRRPPLQEIWPWLLLLLLLVIGGLLAAYFLSRDNDHHKSSASGVTVPAIVGVKQSEAVRRLDQAGLVPQLATGRSKFPAGTVFAQDPGAGTRVERGSLVKVSVSAAGQTALPNLKVPRGSKVRVNVSTGSASSPGTTTSGTTTTPAPRTVKVPNVLGLQQTVAQRRLHSAGLGTRVKYVSSQKPSGQVVAESPTAGTTVRRGATVQISVSLGPSATTTQVPNVVGQDQQTATNTLQNAGFQVQVIAVPASDSSQNGVVVDEQPSGGTRAPDGSAVTIYVGSSG